MLLDNCVMAVIRASRPTFKNSHDKIAFSLHATFLVYGYLLTAAGPPALQDSAFSSSASSSSNEVSVDGWNSVDEDYAFVYRSPHSSTKVLVRSITINEKLIINVCKNGENGGLIHLEIDSDEYVEEGDAEKPTYMEYYKNFPKLIKTLQTELFSQLSNSSNANANDSPSSSTSTSEGLQVYAYPHADQIPYPLIYGYAYVYHAVPVYHHHAVQVWHGHGAYGNNLVGPGHPQWHGGQWFHVGQHPIAIVPVYWYGHVGWPNAPAFGHNQFVRQPRPQGGRGRGPRLLHP